ncbi:MAG: helix-turn-helix transcriptional regulator [Lachnospiraceae bacterium]
MNNTTINIGERIKSLREESGFTQGNIAKYLEVDQSLISKIEKGDRFITSDMLDKLTALFGITTEDFYNDSFSTKQISFALRANELNEDDLETISAINRIALNIKFMTQLLGGNGLDR